MRDSTALMKILHMDRNNFLFIQKLENMWKKIGRKRRHTRREATVTWTRAAAALRESVRGTRRIEDFGAAMEGRRRCVEQVAGRRQGLSRCTYPHKPNSIRLLFSHP